jgi:trigger factor
VAVEDYLRVTGQTGEELATSVRPRAEDSVKKDLALEAVVAAEGIEVTDEMIEAWIREQAAEGEEEPEEAVARLMGDQATMTALRQDLAAQKALDVVVEHAKPITPEQAEAKGKLWTPGQESGGPGEKPSPIWTPAGAGGPT